MMHREGRDFSILMESFASETPEHSVLGTGGVAIQAGHVIETAYRGAPERWRVRSISRRCGDVWAATVVPAPVLSVVAAARG